MVWDECKGKEVKEERSVEGVKNTYEKYILPINEREILVQMSSGSMVNKISTGRYLD